jgi:hypothetical protein
MIKISSYQHQSLQRPVQVGRIGDGLAGLVWVTAPLALAAAMVGLAVDGVHACARPTVTSGALIRLRWRSAVGAFRTTSPGSLGLHRRGCSRQSDSFALSCSSRGRHLARCQRGVRTVLRSPR